MKLPVIWVRIMAGLVLVASLPVAEGGSANAAEPIAARPGSLEGRVVILGDSITYAGTWLGYLETVLRLSTAPGGSQFELINLGLPSETVSGLSEEGHAGGAFPRPVLEERLERALERIKPRIILACYGMNDGIYLPFNNERAEKFRAGIRRLHEEAEKRGIRIIHMTPPVFDPMPLTDSPLFKGYNNVLDLYSEWLMAQQDQAWEVVDVHSNLNRYLTARRQMEPGFVIAPDAVHPGVEGHWQIARAVLEHLGISRLNLESAESAFAPYTQVKALLGKIGEKQRTLRDAWLSEVGHKRPGISAGLPLAEAEERARALEVEIQDLLRRLPEPVIERSALGVVSIRCVDTNLMLRYTLDGTDPQRGSGAYLAPFSFPWRGMVRARAFTRDDIVQGPVAWAAYEPTGHVSNALPRSSVVPITQNRDWRVYDWPSRHSAIVEALRKRKPALVFMGDSITHFWGGEPLGPIRNGADVWERYYAKRNALNLGFGWDRTENLLWRLQNGELAEANPKVAVVLIGTNNLDVNTPDEVFDGVKSVCAEIHHQSPATRILLLGLLPRSEKPDSRRTLIKEVNSRLAKLDGEKEVVFLDIGPKFLGPEETISKDLMADFLHPTARGYEILAESIEPLLKLMLREE